MRKLKTRAAVVIAVLVSLILPAVAWAYLNVENAGNYATAHMWRTYCNYRCDSYPNVTDYERINNNYVRVSVGASNNGRYCRRTFAVRGNNGSEYITTEGSSYGYVCV